MQYRWKLPNGQEIAQPEISQVFTTSGTFPIELIAENKCGADSMRKNLTVQDLPVAASAIDSGSVSFTNNTYRVCLGGGGLVRLTAEDAKFAQSYTWSISSSAGVVWEGSKNQAITRLDFNQPGLYTITLRVDNGCNEPDETSFQVEVLDSSSLSLAPQPDECLSLSYRPNPLNPDAIYSIDGQEIAQANFPLTLVARNEPYVVHALLPNVCGDLIRRDTFRVFAPTTPTLLSPAQDTAVCSGTELLLLRATPSGGSWMPHERIIQQGNQFFFDPDGPAGDFMLTYSYGSGACARSAALTITTKSVTLDIGPLEENYCIDAGEVTLSANPGNGQWSGPGVDTASGIFQPEVAGAGSHTLSYTFQDGVSGCAVKKEKTAIVNLLPELSLADSTATCLVDAALPLADLTNIQMSPEGGSFNWQGGGVVNSTDGLYNPSVFGVQGVDTIRVEYTSPQKCRSAGMSLIRIRDLVEAATIPDSTLCLGTDPSLTLPGFPGGGSWEGNWIGEQTGAIDLNTAQEGTFSYTYTIQKNTPCQSSASVALTFVPGGSVNAGPDLYVCESDNLIALDAGAPSAGNWSGPVPVTNGNQVNIQALSPGVFTFTYSIPSLPAACNSDTRQLIIDSLPASDFQIEPVACIDTLLNLSAQTSHAERWEWNFGNNQSNSGAMTTFTYTGTGDFTVSLTTSTLHPVTGQALCRSTVSHDIIVTEPPTLVDFTVSDIEGCGPLNVTLDNISQGNFLEYLWQLTDGQTSTEEEPGMLNLQPGIEDTIYQVKLAVYNGCGGSEQMREIKVLPMPRADFGVDFAQPCSGDSLWINNTSTGNPAVNQWTIGPLGGTDLSFTTFNPPLLRPKTDTLPRDLHVHLMTSNACGMDTITKLVTVFPTDVRALINIADKTVCVRDTVVLTSFSTPGSNLRWELEGNTFADRQIRPVFTAPGTYRASLFAERCGYDSNLVEFTVLPLPEIIVSGDFLACEDAPATFTVVTDAPAHRLYFGTGDSSLLNDVAYAYDTAGIFPIDAVAISAEGCRNFWEGTVTVEAKPQVAFSFMDSLCARTPVRFISNGQSLSCQWRFDGQDPQDSCNPDYIFSEAGLHPVQLTLSPATGCRDSLTKWVYVRPTPTADFEIQTIEDCSPAVFRFQNRSENATGLLWDFGDNNTSTQQTPEHQFPQAGTYPIRLQASYDGICFSEVSKTIEVFPTPIIQIEQDEQCTTAEGVDVSIRTDIDAFIVLSGVNYSEAGDFHPGLAPGVYEVQAESASGCLAMEEILVLPVQELQISLPEDSFSINMGETIRLEVLSNLVNSIYNWAPPENLSDPATANPLATPFRTVDYTIAVSDEKGCIKMDTVHIEVLVEREKGIYLPNAFTPDGSGHNDVFRLRINNPGVRRIREFRVYDRWGEQVFSAEDCEPDDPHCVWDGQFRGQKVAIDIYVYYIEIEFVDGESRIMKGEINLIR